MQSGPQSSERRGLATTRDRDSVIANPRNRKNTITGKQAGGLECRVQSHQTHLPASSLASLFCSLEGTRVTAQERKPAQAFLR